MKIKHRVPSTTSDPAGDYVDPAYEKQVQQSTARLEKKYRDAQRRLQAAQERRASAIGAKRKPSKQVLKRLDAEVEARRQELLALERQMTSFPGGGIYHRGTGNPKPHSQGRAL